MSGKNALIKELMQLTQDKEMAQKICLMVERWFSDEQEHKRKCQKEGIEKARKKGVAFGRPRIQEPDNFDRICSQYMEGELNAAAAAKLCNMGVSTFYRRVNLKYEE